jgi:DNA repair exonuclease SbcCD ATPase subunit
MSAIDRTAPAIQPALRVRAAAAATQPNELPKFKTIESYETFVRSSDVTKLPAARALTSADNKLLADAKRALESRKNEVGYAALTGAVAQAEAKLDVADHPMRPQAERIQAEIPELSARSASLQQQISVLNNQISSMQADQSNNNYNSYNNNDTSLAGALLSAAATVAVSVADSAGINNAQKQIRDLINQKANVEAQIMTKTVTAATLANQPGRSEDVKPFLATLDAARQELAKGDAAIKPQVDAVASAQRIANTDGNSQGRLESLQNDLKNYDQRFGPITQTQLWWKDHSWKKSLDLFWSKLGG